MLNHHTMSLALAHTRRDDLVRELRPDRGGPRAPRLDGAQIAPDRERLNRRLGPTLLRALRSRAAEPAS